MLTLFRATYPLDQYSFPLLVLKFLKIKYSFSVDGESEKAASRRKEQKSFWVTGQRGLTFAEAAKMIVEEAREFLQKDLGIQVNWESQEEREQNLASILNGK